jgi:hypothetical protein
MNGQAVTSTDEVSFFDEIDYLRWGVKIKDYFK